MIYVSFYFLQAGRLITQGKQKFQAGDRMGALKFWEDALKPEADADINQRKIALFNATCVHASFGDVELAQITLREAIQLGLDYIKAVQTPEEVDPSLVPLIASQQVLIRLRKFNESTLKAIGAASVPPPTFSSSKASSTTAKRGPSILQDDLSRVLETDMQGIDTSVFGIVRRVFVLLLVLAGLGVALYLIGLQYLFPDVSGM